MLFELQIYTKTVRIGNLSQYPIISVVRERRSDRHGDRERESLDFSVALIFEVTRIHVHLIPTEAMVHARGIFFLAY